MAWIPRRTYTYSLIGPGGQRAPRDVTAMGVTADPHPVGSSVHLNGKYNARFKSTSNLALQFNQQLG